jgi:hypothetical protein
MVFITEKRRWKKLHNEELRNLYSVPNIIRVNKSRRMRWAGQVARIHYGRQIECMRTLAKHKLILKNIYNNNNNNNACK